MSRIHDLTCIVINAGSLPERALAHRYARGAWGGRRSVENGPAMDDRTEERLTALEIKASYSEDLLDRLNEVVVRQ